MNAQLSGDGVFADPTNIVVSWVQRIINLNRKQLGTTSLGEVKRLMLAKQAGVPVRRPYVEPAEVLFLLRLASSDPTGYACAFENFPFTDRKKLGNCTALLDPAYAQAGHWQFDFVITNVAGCGG